ncbi:MAG TPA: hypothetical protein VGN01_09555 [Acidobacteriaceae bacterium]|jgi:hypothetical protein
MRAGNSRRKTAALVTTYVLATIQFVWCYFQITQPYVNTVRYELGHERMPFQGRMLMVLPLRWAHESRLLTWFAEGFRGHSTYWFPKPVTPEVLVQAAVDVSCLLLAGWLTTKLYRLSSSRQLLTPVIYPLFLAACAATYVMHTAQNFRYVYDFPSLAFFAAAMVLLYLRKHWAWFVALFCVATVNRETSLLLLPLYMIDGAMGKDRLEWRRLLSPKTLAVVLPLAGLWAVWEGMIHRLFALHRSEFYLRFDWNLKSLALPLAWPQLLSTGGYLLLFVMVMRRRVSDRRLRAWLWLVPVWIGFMFVYGILIETRIFGELIPLMVCSTALICEEMLVARMRIPAPKPELAVVDGASAVRKAA